VWKETERFVAESTSPMRFPKTGVPADLYQQALTVARASVPPRALIPM